MIEKPGFCLGLLGCGGAINERGAQGNGRRLADLVIPLNLFENLFRIHPLRRGAWSKHLCSYTSKGLASPPCQLTKTDTLVSFFLYVKKEIK